MLFIIFLWAGIACMAFSTLGSIGYGLYLWGGTGVAFSTSCWLAFTVWLKTVGIGVISFIICYVIGYKVDRMR